MAEAREGELLKYSNVITLKDIITFVSIIVAMTMAWGVFGTRLTVAEKELVYQTQNSEKMQKQIDSVSDKVDKLQMRIIEDEDTIQSLWQKSH
jgi:peptidoglycan hydrolase CwlO-like protein